jgi:DNA-binding beta-propeller fold protein YncE
MEKHDTRTRDGSLEFESGVPVLEETVLTMIKSYASMVAAVILCVVLGWAISAYVTADATTGDAAGMPVGSFERVATYDVPGEVAEIIASTPDGKTLIYTDSASEEIGFVNIIDPRHPTSGGSLAMPGEPTSVTVTPDGVWALVVVHGSSQDTLVVVELATRTIGSTIVLGGQPDSIAISADGRYAAIAIENERDEDVNDGEMPQAPPGFLTIVDLVGPPSAWTMRDVALTGLAERFPSDPEPEYVAINASNQAAVTLQENNHIVIVDLETGTVVTHWSAGTTTHAADTVEDNDIQFINQIVNARREPDAIAWTPGGRLITANEGDYDLDLAAGEFVGGRDFTVFSSVGNVLFEPGATFELEAVRHGHYPDARSESRGIETEGVAVGVYHQHTVLFVGSERGNFIAVYRLDDETNPEFVQILPTGMGPEGLLPIPQRGLFVTANEEDGTISIFQGRLGRALPTYPQVVSDGLAWSALSGLAAGEGSSLYAVPDNAFSPSRIWTLTLGHRAKVQSALTITKEGGLASYDLEGIAVRPQGGWWVVSEGVENFGQVGLTKNLLIRLQPDGSVAEEVDLPEAVNQQQQSNGFEGVATDGDGSQVYVAFQREWTDDPAGFVKIGRYTPATHEWAFYHYPLDAAPADGWVGLSEITWIANDTLLVVERDNQQRDNAQVKRLYSFPVAGISPAPAGSTPPVLAKTLVRNLLLEDDYRLEKIEGAALTKSGELLVVNDNDGAGETRLLRLRGVMSGPPPR